MTNFVTESVSDQYSVRWHSIPLNLSDEQLISNTPYSFTRSYDLQSNVVRSKFPIQFEMGFLNRYKCGYVVPH